MVLDRLRSGAWLTRERVRLVACAVLLASAASFIYLVVTADGVVDTLGRPLGTDFSNVYAAGTYVLEGRPQAPFDPALQYAREQAIFGAATPFYGWHYPPFFLFVAGALALMPYWLALAVWQAVTLVLYLWVIGKILAETHPSPQRGEGWGEGVRSQTSSSEPPHPSALRAADLSPPGRGDKLWLLLAVAFPTVFVNLGHGHNGFLTAALFGAALVLLDRRPVAAGILFGLLAYKPQFGLMIPLVLAASGRWRSFAAAGATVALLALATTLVFGSQVWDAFLASTGFTREVVLEQGDTGWHKIQSVFAWARMWGGSIALAYVLQAAATVALGAALVWLWRATAPLALKAAALCLAAILATPYSLDYDMMVLAPAIAFLAADGFARGFAPWEKTALATLWLVPLIARSVAQATMIPLGVPVMLAAFVLVLHRASIHLSIPHLFALRAIK